jgi:type IX secretion system PorP/SprF family membrane protein
MKKFLKSIVILAGVFSLRLSAQDFHVTQYDAFTMYLNPALTGNFLTEKADYRMQAIYRSQWRPLVAKSFSTFGMGYDARYKKYGYGGYILNNHSGVAAFNTMQVQASGSYFITNPIVSPHWLNVGLQLGIFYKTFDQSKVLFESQYDYSTGTLRSDIGNNENFSRTSLVKLDPNFGVFYKYKDWRAKFSPHVGVSIFHLSIPKENFSSQNGRVPMRFLMNAGCDYKIDDKWSVTPTLLYMNQARASEFNIGALGYYSMESSSNSDIKYDIIFGLNYRWKDALMFQAGLKKNNIALRMSYDINVSYLSSYSSGRGAFEMTLIIFGKKGEPVFKGVSQF